jgi:rhamnulokinase
MQPEAAVYISCGTWGLVGVEVEHPVLTPAALAANFTNEGGVDGRDPSAAQRDGPLDPERDGARLGAHGAPVELTALLDAAATCPGIRPPLRRERPALPLPGDMPDRRLVR